MHNMIIENERGEEEDYDYDQDGGEVLRPEKYKQRDPLVLEEFLKIHHDIKNRQMHERLRDDPTSGWQQGRSGLGTQPLSPPHSSKQSSRDGSNFSNGANSFRVPDPRGSPIPDGAPWGNASATC
jgi:hypothetical protein